MQRKAVGIWSVLWPTLVLSTVLSLMACGAADSTVVLPGTDEAREPVALHVVCSEGIAPAIQAAAAAYGQNHPEVDITLLVRADTLAWQALQTGDAEVAVLTWLPEALGNDTWVRILSRDGLAIVVHPRNQISSLTVTQLQDLFQGRVEDWAAWGGPPGPPMVVSREAASGEASFFQAWVMRDARTTLTAVLAPSTDAVLQYVAGDLHAVGYVSTARLDGRVRAVPINGVSVDETALQTGQYPLVRTHFVLTLREPVEPARSFVQWLLEAPGQTVLSAWSLIPASDSGD